MMKANWMKIAGIVDGVAMAALVELGQQVPAWSPETLMAVKVLGLIGTLLGGTHMFASAEKS